MTERRVHLDALRVLAIFFVVMNHTGYAGQLYYLQIHEHPLHWLLMGFSALHKTAVPLFLMVSGALLIGKEESFRELFRKRILRFSMVLLLFSLLGYLYDIRDHLADFNYFYFFTNLYSYRLVDSYWYLYCYLGYLLVLPFLRRLGPAMRDRDYLYLVMLWLVFKGVDLLPIFVLGEQYGLSETFVLFVLEYTFFFPLMGYYLERRLAEKCFTRKNARLALLAMLLATALMCLATERWCTFRGEWPAIAGEITFGALNFVSALALYFIAKTLFLHHPTAAWLSAALRTLGACSFGLYLLQHYFLAWLRPVYTALSPVIGSYPACLVWVLCICLAGSGVTFLLRLIPGLNKLI